MTLSELQLYAKVLFVVAAPIIFLPFFELDIDEFLRERIIKKMRRDTIKNRGYFDFDDVRFEVVELIEFKKERDFPKITRF